MTDDERRAVEQAVRDYFDSWFEGDTERMAGVLHPDLAKRRAAGSGSELIQISTPDLMEDVASGPKTGYDRAYEVQVLDIGQDMASAVVIPNRSPNTCTSRASTTARRSSMPSIAGILAIT